MTHTHTHRPRRSAGSPSIPSAGCLLLCVIAAGCARLEPSAPAAEDVLDGTVDGLTHEQNARHARGDEAFSHVFTRDAGLGPVFVAGACIDCHAGDGSGTPFTTLVRFGQRDSSGNQYLHLGAPQLQNRALPGVQPERLPDGVASARFLPPGATGLGYFELVSDADILTRADPNDADGDGISGRANWIALKPYVQPRADAASIDGKYIGRFGRKAAVYNLLQQTASAYNQDIGVTSTFEPMDAHTLTDIDPEIPSATVHDVVFYLQTLKAPVQRNPTDPSVIAGRDVFETLRCSRCHTPELRTGASTVASLSQTAFRPYTDLLLHDMGSGLDDGYTEGSAASSEWRTAPLWGLGLAPRSQGGVYFLLHDGRARSIDEAVLLHGGEAAAIADAYRRLSSEDKRRLLIFLESL